ncbi:POT family proton-dependent oligopeptide transporter [Sphingomonas sp. BE270]|jgi:POT family proton-dependent oligopeptide transporter|uniref:peptide MFS transporter n=1 Tax=unclassified Sphingomonas TaxID=196159 RepID=UPI00053D41E9|nr:MULTISPECIES: peptide MFS transporter [unclassified Sphingomonas]MDR6848411.1 POT family proton-dependent oligopeptide transporter [Sphingomonas sp. BE137]MDR7259073.1 POT family proton-dependent oligopeptide transporter [Sphingomonas sp. BE270]
MVDTPTADTPREPDITHVNPATGAMWFGHPRQLARLFTTEMWERFGYYGMRALLTLYLTKHFVFGDRAATGLYGGFTALVYLTPLVGGYLADQYLGSKRSVKFGAIMMAVGYFTLCFGGQTAVPFATIDGQRYDVQVEAKGSTEQRYIVDHGKRLQVKGNDDGTVSLLAPDGSSARTIAKDGFKSDAERSPLFVTIMLLALSLISVGNGFFKPNISTMVGELYPQGDRRRDSGFTIFYMGINLGSLGSQILCPILADTFGWWAGFGLAAVGMLISYALIQFDGGKLNGYGEAPVRSGPDRALPIYIGALVAVPVLYFLFTNLMNAVPPVPGSGFIGYLASLSLMGKLLFGTFLISIPGILIWSFVVGDRREFQMMLAAMVLIVFNVVFWTLFEQAGSSLTLFADRNTDLRLFGDFAISAPQTQFFNAFFIVTLAPVMSVLWTALAKRGLEPSIPVKFGIALIGVGAGFLFLVLGAGFAGPNFQVGIWWLAGLYLIHSVAELCISPVGLSMITKLSIARIVGLMMGVWFLSISCAQYVAGIVAQFASVDTVGGEVTNLKVSLDTYTGTFTTIAEVAMALGVLLLLLAWPLKKWMHGVK